MSEKERPVKYKKKELDAVQLGDELLLCEKTGQQVHRLNGTAGAIWKLCDGQKGPGDMAGHLAREFRGASAKKIETDVLATLEELTKLGIIDSCDKEVSLTG